METKVRCKHCEAWIPSRFRLGRIKTFDIAVFCPSCGETTRCDKANMRAHYVGEGKEGGFIGIETT